MTDQVKTRVEQELLELSEMNTRIQAFIQEMSMTQSDVAKDALINAIALNLHSFYTGVERIFEVIARQIDYSEPSARSRHADLVVGTSTIDIGVDFKINFLLFESSDAGNFIQRLGRLGRHSSYDHQGRNIPFEDFTAYALVPKFFVERLFTKENAPLQSGESYNRLEFNQAVTSNYRLINDFAHYYKRWGIIQSFQLWWDLGKPEIKAQYASSREKFKEDSEQVFKNRLKSAAGRVMGWGREYETAFGKKGNPIFKDISSFRGSSPLQCGLYDTSEIDERDRFKTYDLPGILSNLPLLLQNL